MTPDDRLIAFLAESPVPAVTDVFVAEVMEAVERRAFFDRLLAGGAGGHHERHTEAVEPLEDLGGAR